MAVDYTIYNNQYRYMEQMLRQIREGSSMASASASSLQTAGFSDILRMAGKEDGSISAGSMDTFFEEAAQAYQVPVNLLKAIGKTESNFDPNAQSGAGAQGVMQLMPETARGLGVTDPFDARSNIMGGAKYIADMLNRYDGDLDLALAAYNAGSGNVEKYGGVPPFQETQNYIKKVREYMGTDLQAGQTAVRTEALGQDTGGFGVCSVCGAVQGSSIDSSGLSQMLSEFMRLQIESRMLSASDYTNAVI